MEELPEGTWRGVNEELPEGTWRGGMEELPEGTWRGVKEELPEGTWRANYVGNYECGDHSGDVYGFRFVEQTGGYEIDIISQPEYNGKDESLQATRRIATARGSNGIDLGDVVPVTLAEAQKMAGSWAEQNQLYRHSGMPTGGLN